MDKKYQESDPDSPSQKDIQPDSDKSSRQAIPVYLLNDSIKFCAKIYAELGVGDFHSKDLIAKIHDVAYISIKQKFSTAQYYGLLELKHGVGYKLTPLFLKIHKPETEAEKQEGIVESLHQPEIYAKLINEFNGHPLPSEQGLSARLLRTFGIKEYAATKAAQIFITNLRNNSLVNGNNILNVSKEPTPSAKNDNGEAVQRNGGNGAGNHFTPDQLHQPLPPPPDYIEIPIPLSGGKRAYLRIPEDYKPEDCERIAKFVDALK